MWTPSLIVEVVYKFMQNALYVWVIIVAVLIVLLIGTLFVIQFLPQQRRQRIYNKYTSHLRPNTKVATTSTAAASTKRHDRSKNNTDDNTCNDDVTLLQSYYKERRETNQLIHQVAKKEQREWNQIQKDVRTQLITVGTAVQKVQQDKRRNTVPHLIKVD